MKTSLDHVAIAVPDLADTLRFYREVLGLEVEPPEEVPSQRVRVQFVRFDEAPGATIELVEPSSADSPVGRFLERRGSGLHHIALRVPDIAAALAELKARGVRLIDETPRPGAHGALVAFVHPSSTRGVLLEIKQG